MIILLLFFYSFIYFSTKEYMVVEERGREGETTIEGKEGVFAALGNP